MISPVHAAALDYLARGWSVIPIGADKKPRIAWDAFKTRHATPEEVGKWSRQWPDAGVGIVCGAISGLVVFDRDGEKGAANLLHHGITYPDTPRVRTNRGEHVYFRHPGAAISSYSRPDTEKVNAETPYAVGLEWKGDGGYVVAPPSRHPSGTTYAWDVAPDVVDLADLPEWFWTLYGQTGKAALVTPGAPTSPPPIMANDAPEPAAPDTRATDAPPLPYLADFLEDLARERSPSDAGGVPLPSSWTCFRATLEGASRGALERAYRPEAIIVNGARSPQDAERQLARSTIETLAHIGSHLPPGLHIITGQTGGAKTAFALNLARAALKGWHPVLYVSMELDAVELAARMVGLELAEKEPLAQVSWWQLARRRELSPPQRAARAVGIDAVREMAARMAVLVATDLLDPRTLRDHVLRLWRQWGRVPLVVFDYLQAAGIGGDDLAPSLRQHIATIALTLRRLSQDAATEEHNGATWPGCPVVVQSITARNNVRGDGAVQGMNGESPDDLRYEDLETLKALPKEAGEIEATAVTAWVLALEDSAEAGPRALTARLAKYRGAIAGQWIPFRFDGRTGLVTEESSRYATPTTSAQPNEPPKQRRGARL